MIKKITFLILACSISPALFAQPDEKKDYRNFPLIVSLQFHSLAMPFRDIRTNFRNIGIGLGTEVSINGTQHWVQQINAVWYRNKAVGNGLFFYSQMAWRPTIASNIYTELKGGAGYLLSFRPVESYQQVNGIWQSAGHKGKGMLTIPLGISVGYNNYSSQSIISPFISYQFLLVTKYNTSIPLVPETLVQIGSRIHLN